VMNQSEQAIDAVITWVDGGDSAHIAKINQALTALGFTPRSAASTRFASRGEIFQCLRSIHTFAPFIRKIFIVTDNQRPNFEVQPNFDQALLDKIQIVDHKEIFRDHLDLLPTFNSRSIEVMLYRIPGLAEQYVYFNDDMSLVKPVKPSDFFGGNGPVLRGHFDKMPQYRIKRRFQRFLTERFNIQFNTYQNYSYKLSQAKSAEFAGFKDQKFYLLGHNPHALRRSTFERFFEQHPEILAINLRDKFRTAKQFNVAALAYHLELQQGNGHPQKNRNLLYIQPKNYFFLKSMLKDATHNPQKLFCCVQSLDLFSEPNQERIWQWLETQLEIHA
jgi:Stealth protein CR2, conserved region 2/Stealth protein CR1, conserved region 1